MALPGCSSTSSSTGGDPPCFAHADYGAYPRSYYASRQFYGSSKPYFGYGGYGAHRNAC